MSAASLSGVSKNYGRHVALDRIDLEVDAGEMLVLLGPSGSGKTTILRLLAGLETPDEGTIHLGDRVANDPAPRISPESRGIGMVFQDLALWPHMTVRKMLGFVLAKRTSRSERKRRVEEAAEMAGIAHRLKAKPGTLSGGERQRVAIARALVMEPSLLLFDEPLTGLDEALRIQMTDAIVAIRERLDVAAVYVTHHPEEALAMATRVAVLDEGRLLQADTPQEVYAHPADRRVAEILGSACFLPGKRIAPDIVETDAGLVGVQTGGPDGRVLLVVRPRAVRVDLDGSVKATARRSFFEGDGWRVLADIAGREVLLESPMEVTEGQEIQVRFDPPPAVVGNEP